MGIPGHVRRASVTARLPHLPPWLSRVALRVTFGLLLLWVALEVYLGIAGPTSQVRLGLGHDHTTYMDAVNRFLSGGSFYQPYQLAGPYTVVEREVLYPPLMIPLLALFSFLPAVLWWAIPIGISVAVVAYWRPGLGGWTGILACLAIPETFDLYANGNPGIWVAAFVALATVWGWPAVFVILKPSLAPFMLLGINRRSWWLAAGLLALVTLAFTPLWLDYATVILNARGPLVSPLYSLRDVPLLMIPIFAWRGRGRHDRPRGI